ncbi:hypothetical protein HDV00_000897 [Rhizophlyctis rosea]|nr:hypothetical protein HDV00_000897 [Rhizophlyctis rosea]
MGNFTGGKVAERFTIYDAIESNGTTLFGQICPSQYIPIDPLEYTNDVMMARLPVNRSDIQPSSRFLLSYETARVGCGFGPILLYLPNATTPSIILDGANVTTQSLQMMTANLTAWSVAWRPYLIPRPKDSINKAFSTGKLQVASLPPTPTILALIDQNPDVDIAQYLLDLPLGTDFAKSWFSSPDMKLNKDPGFAALLVNFGFSLSSNNDLNDLVWSYYTYPAEARATVSLVCTSASTPESGAVQVRNGGIGGVYLHRDTPVLDYAYRNHTQWDMPDGNWVQERLAAYNGSFYSEYVHTIADGILQSGFTPLKYLGYAMSVYVLESMDKKRAAGFGTAEVEGMYSDQPLGKPVNAIITTTFRLSFIPVFIIVPVLVIAGVCLWLRLRASRDTLALATVYSDMYKIGEVLTKPVGNNVGPAGQRPDSLLEHRNGPIEDIYVDGEKAARIPYVDLHHVVSKDTNRGVGGV